MGTTPSTAALSTAAPEAPAARPGRDGELSALVRDPGGRPLLLTGGTVITADPSIGDWERADVLIGAGVIAGVGPGLLTAAEDDGMIVLDCAGCVVLPAAVDLSGAGGGGTLTPGARADVAVFRIADAPGTPPGAAPARGSHLDLLFTGGRLRRWNGADPDRPDGPPAPAAAPGRDGDHRYTGLWVTDDRFIRQELRPDGRYDEARGDRESAYTGRYRVTGSRIDYLDDLGFWAFGAFDGEVLHHAGYRFTRG